MDKDQKGFVVYGDIKAVLDKLNDLQVAELFRGMVNYFVSGKVPEFTDVLEFVFIPIKQQMDRDMDKYKAKCEKNRSSIQSYWDRVKSNTNEYERIQTNTNATNTNTNTDTNTKKDTDTDTTTNTDTDTTAGSGSGFNDDFNIWSKLTPADIDEIYEAYPNTGGDLIEAVVADVKQKKKRVKKAKQYILGYAKKVSWDDNMDHFIAPWEAN